VAPEFPIILTDDGALHLVVTQPQQSRDLVCQICSIAVFNKKLLEWRGLVHNYPFISPVILPANFFRGTKHDGQHKETGGPTPAAGLASLSQTTLAVSFDLCVIQAC
jgi:hypothetical protein